MIWFGAPSWWEYLWLPYILIVMLVKWLLGIEDWGDKEADE
jgi:hypothetical protein